MPQVKDLPGAPGIRDAEFFYSVSGCLSILRRGVVAGAAGDDGAINVWRDDSGILRANRCVRWSIVDTQQFDSIERLKQWLGPNLKLIMRDQ